MVNVIGCSLFDKAICIDIVFLFHCTLDGLIVFLEVKRGYSGKKQNSPKCIALLENINGLFGNVNKKIKIIIIDI
jgi:hypothetical protein